MAIMMGCFRFAEDYTNTIFSMAIGIVVILCLKPIFEKYSYFTMHGFNISNYINSTLI